MTGSRPKRKATINKSYNDTPEEHPYDETTTIKNAQPADPAAGTVAVARKKTVKKPSVDAGKPKTKTLPYNWQPAPTADDYFSHRLDLTDAYIDLKTQTLHCPHNENGCATLQKGEYVYMVSEPPGEPYYIGRIMGFKSKSNETTIPAQPTAVSPKDYVFQIQWFYRPRDISKSTADSRLLYSSMHTDTCPIASFRGKVTVRHKQDIEDEYGNANGNTTNGTNGKKSASPASSALEAYTQQPNCFYFDKLFDRYMLKVYDVLSTANMLQYTKSPDSKSRNFLTALHKRFEFIFVESQRTKPLINTFSSTSCNCHKCGQWCGSSQDSITCVVCDKYFHMLCLDPPLLKKPSRGFSWSCAVCTKKQDIEYQRKKILMLSHDNKSSNASQLSNELSALSSPKEGEMDPVDAVEAEADDTLPKYETMAIDFLQADAHLSLEQRRMREEWCMRYLGMYSRLEEGVDLEDRSPYPRASTRLGARHQATNIPETFERPVVYYDPVKPKKNSKSGKSASPSKSKRSVVEEQPKLQVPEEFADTDPRDYPVWLQPRPKGYIERGEDDGEGVSCTLMWKSRPQDESDGYEKLDRYISQCESKATQLGMLPTSPNFMDAILKAYMDNDGDVSRAMSIVDALTRKSLHEPTFNEEEIKRFESGVKQFGSELLYVRQQVRTQPAAMVVRFYYLWKKTKNGQLIWGNYEGRMQKKLQNVKDEQKDHKLASIDDLADPDDDSSYESNKITQSNRTFTCKHCLTHTSRRWYRITGHDANRASTIEAIESGSEKYKDSVVGLCFRCARIWRRYAVLWESPSEVEKKVIKTSGWKKKVEWELLQDATRILEEAEARGASISYDEDISEPTMEENVHVKKPVKPKVESDSKKKRPVEESQPGESTGSKAKKKKSASTTKTVKKPAKSPEAKATVPKKAKKEVKEPEQPQVSEVKEPPKPPRKRKVKEETPETSVGEDEVKAEEKPPAQKRQRKATQPTSQTLTPPLNPNYEIPMLKSLARVDKKTVHILNKDVLKEIVQSFHHRQLLDISSQFHGLQLQHLSSIALPFDPSERKCCLCREHDTENSSDEMLICSHCGVNVHSTCVGINIPDHVVKPVKEWLCEPCINDLKPNNSTVYSCSLCLANESNNELAIVGSPLVKPDYLKPIAETGKWCHLLCAIFSHNLVDFRLPNNLVALGSSSPGSVVSPKSPTPVDSTKKPRKSVAKRSKDKDPGSQSSVIELTQSPISIEGVSRVYLKNYHTKCGICDSRNGSMIRCDLCEDDKSYHITCAQDTANFKLGFKLDAETEKNGSGIKIGNTVGRLKPILVCPKHDQSATTINSMRALGKRGGGATKEEVKPLIQLFLEDLARFRVSKSSGPQFRSNNYIQNCKLFQEEDELLRAKVQSSYFGTLPVKLRPTCSSCHTAASPIWWSTDSSTGQKYIVSSFEGTDLNTLLCQTCHHEDESDDDTPDEVDEPLSQVLHKPIDGSNYGISNQSDSLMNMYTPNLVSKYESETTRSKISIGDILS